MPEPPATPPLRTLLARGLSLACPACGARGLFRRWFTMTERCPRCSLRFERIEGHWVGSLGINTIVTFGVLAAFGVTAFAVSYPDPPAALITVVGVALAVVVPLAAFPLTRTLWTAIDLAMRPLRPGEIIAVPREQEEAPHG